jgi:hypothetical protein
MGINSVVAVYLCILMAIFVIMILVGVSKNRNKNN